MAGRTDDVLVEVGAGLAFWGGGLLAVFIFDGWPSYVLASLAFGLGVYLMLAVWLDWPRPSRKAEADRPPGSVMFDLEATGKTELGDNYTSADTFFRG